MRAENETLEGGRHLIRLGKGLKIRTEHKKEVEVVMGVGERERRLSVKS